MRKRVDNNLFDGIQPKRFQKIKIVDTEDARKIRFSSLEATNFNTVCKC